MNHQEVGKYWNDNAKTWTQLARAGYDTYRDYLNTPAFLAMLPDVQGLSGLDIGCGEGHNTREVAKQGAHLIGIDISDVFIRYAQEMEKKNPISCDQVGIEFQLGSAIDLTFPDNHFDFAIATMSLMDIAEIERALSESYRVIKPGGFLQFSITHPCFDTPHRKNLRNKEGQTYAIEVGDYFHNLNGKISEWLFSSAPDEIKRNTPKFKVPRFNHTISQWLNLLIQTGFTIELVEEPYPSNKTAQEHPEIQDAQVVAYFMIIRVRKTNGCLTN